MPLTPHVVRAPGRYGLNTQAEAQSDTWDWASELLNVVYDDYGRIAARKGWEQLTTTPIAGTPDIEAVFEYKVNATTTKIISAADGKLYHGTATLTDITGALTPTADLWQFQNFNGKVVGWQAGHTPIVYNNTGNFADIVVASGTLPDGNAVLSAFGRLWAYDDDRTTLRYSALLDETKWAAVDGGGTIDLKSSLAAPHSGIDFGVALAEFNGLLVVLMTNTIILYANAEDPTNIAIADVINGLGCSARDSVQDIGEELLFLDPHGLHGLRRALESADNLPMAAYTTRVRDVFVGELLATGAASVVSAHNKSEGFYLIASKPYIWCFDLKSRLEDGTFRVSRWDGMNPTALYFASDRIMYMGQPGVIGKYEGYTDNGSFYRFRFDSNWAGLGSPNIKIPKKAHLTVVLNATYSHTITLGYDYEDAVFTQNVSAGNSEGTAEWGIMEWGLFEWGGASKTDIVKVNTKGVGEIIKFGVSVGINGAKFAVQQIKLFYELGRLAR
jgi:hypothetical protein